MGVSGLVSIVDMMLFFKLVVCTTVGLSRTTEELGSIRRHVCEREGSG